VYSQEEAEAQQFEAVENRRFSVPPGFAQEQPSYGSHLGHKFSNPAPSLGKILAVFFNFFLSEFLISLISAVLQHISLCR
jgi:hypothetical protein